MDRNDPRIGDAFRTVYGRMMDDRPPAPDWESMSTPPPRRAPTRWQPRPWLAAAGAAVVVLVAIGAAAWMFRGGGNQPVDTPTTTVTTLQTTVTAPPGTSQPPTETAAPETTTTLETTTTTTTTLPEPVEGWGRLPVDPALFGAAMVTDGAAAGHRLVLAGCDATGSSSAGFPMWWADDATTWQPAAGPDDAVCVTQVEASPFGFFAIQSGAASNLLHSHDGATWEELDLSADFGLDHPGQLGVVLAVFVSPDGDRVTLLYSRAAENESRVAALVTTTDGVTWQRVQDNSAALFDSSSIGSVIAGGPGLIAVGSSPGGEFTPCAAVFTSPNGLGWTRATPQDSECEGTIMTDVIAVDGGYVAVGGDYFNTGLMIAWTSPDGVAWTRSPSPSDDVDPSVAHVTAETVTSAAGSLWAAGVDFDAGRSTAESRPAMWTSQDGVTWTRVDFAAVRDTIPFVVLETSELTIGVWPPPHSDDDRPVQLFGSG